VSLNDADHQQRVNLLLERVLKVLALAEDDPLIFPAGPPKDPREYARATSLLNADALGNVLGTTYVAHVNRYGRQAARQWLAELLSILCGLVKREAPHDGLDFDELGRLYTDLDRDPEVPDSLPEDFDAGR